MYRRRQDQQAYAEAAQVLRKGLSQPADLLTRQGFGAGWQALRGLGSRLYDSEPPAAMTALTRDILELKAFQKNLPTLLEGHT